MQLDVAHVPGHHVKIWQWGHRWGYACPNFYRVNEAHFTVLLQALVDLERSRTWKSWWCWDYVLATTLPQMVWFSLTLTTNQNVPQQSLDCRFHRGVNSLCHTLQIFLCYLLDDIWLCIFRDVWILLWSLILPGHYNITWSSKDVIIKACFCPVAQQILSIHISLL